MDRESLLNERAQKVNELTLLLRQIDDKLLSLSKEFNWDYKKLSEEEPSNMVECKFNSQHRVPLSKLKVHEEKCFWHQQGYSDTDKMFPEHSGNGSFVTLTPESLQSIVQKVSSCPVSVKWCLFYVDENQNKSPGYVYVTENDNCDSEEKYLRALPQTSTNFDQNFNREEKLAIYDYVIANTQNQKSYSDLWLQPVEKTKEKREMAAWEIAAAERDAKRRRASYRNKVHTNRKTHTEILREVINAQMEAFESEVKGDKSEERMEKPKAEHGRSTRESAEAAEKRKQGSSREERNERKSRDGHSRYREHRRSPPVGRSASKSGSRSDDKRRKWKTYEGRSNSHRSSHSNRR